MKRKLLPLQLIFLFVALLNCKENEINPTPLPDPGFSVSAKYVTISHLQSSALFYIKNEGNTEILWNVESLDPILKAEPATGKVALGDSAKIEVLVDKSKLNEEAYGGRLIVKSDSLPVQLIQVRGIKYEEKKWQLTEELVDAEYDKTHNTIVALTAKTNKLLKIYPETKDVKELDIKMPGNCISLSKDGKYAAIGHNYAISYVNLETMKLEKSIGFLQRVNDIVLAPNGWIYVFPNEFNWTNIVSVKVGSWEEKSTFHSVSGRLVAKLHPSGLYIYSATVSIIPSDFEKYDLSSGPAQILYDSPYHGDYEFSGNIWISEDGKYLFAASGNIFTSNSVETDDIKYLKKLPGNGSIVTLDHSSASGRIMAVHFDASDYTNRYTVKKYDEQFNLLNSYAVPGFLTISGTNYETLSPSEPRLGFLNSDGSKYFLLVSPQATSLKNWALISYPVN